MNAVSSAPVATPKLCPSCGNRYPVDALFCPIDGTPLATARSVSGGSEDSYLGRDLIGHIAIRQLAGIGAMGRVYRAFQKGIDRDVAVKILHRELSTNQQLVSRFHREAKVASRLAHPNVVQVLLTGQLPDGSMYIVMEYLDGLSMQSALAAAGGAMPLPRALHIALQLCDAAGEAHAQGVVHRDIKPENVMLVRRGDDEDYVKVLDFGIARLNWGDQSMATAAGLIFGTARYISPEGAQGEQVGPQGDVYSIATLVFQMLAGRTPFEGDQAVALLVQQIHDAPPSLRSIPRASYVPQPIADVVMRNLAKRPEDRDRDARTFGRALLEAAKASGMSADDLVARPTMLGARASGPVQVASMQRTRQLRLDEDTAQKIAHATSPPSQVKTAYETPAPSASAPSRGLAGTSIDSNGTPLPPGALTTKWAPPADLQAKLAARPHARISNVDATMDDGPAQSAPPRTQHSREDAPHFPTPPPSSVTRTAYEGTPLPTPPPSSPMRVATPLAGAAVSYRAAIDSRPPRSTKPPSNVDSTLSDEEASPRRARSRAAVLVFFCFLLGVGIAGGVAYKLGLMGPAAAEHVRSDQVTKADVALRDHRWDEVKQLTDDGLAMWPNDQELLRVRELACDDLVRAARTKHVAGDLAEATRLAKLARDLDRSDGDAATLATQYERELESAASMDPLIAIDAGLSSLGSARGAPGTSAAKSVGALLDVSTARAKVGQSVDFTARIIVQPLGATRPSVDGAFFVVTGPGLGTGIRIPAKGDDAGVFRAGYVIGHAGRFDVAFQARANGAPLRAARAIQAGDAPPQPLPAPTASGDPPPAPAPTTSAKWL